MNKTVILETNPLVSVGVMTYNSKYVLETLDSIKQQTYHNIELIISDDHSSDNTVERCKRWLDDNRERFLHTEIIESSVNTGPTGNLNRFIKAASGTWIKPAADDILLPDCIEKNVSFINNLCGENVNFIFSQSISFNNETGKELTLTPSNSFSLPDDVHLQYIKLIKKDYINPVTVFYKKSYVVKLGLANEKYPFMDDYPMRLKGLKQGIPFHYMPIVTMRYRITGTSLSSSKKHGKINQKWLDNATKFFQDELSIELKKNHLYVHYLLQAMKFKLQNAYNQTDNKILFILYKGFSSIVVRIYKRII